jgi:hypothetical protein
VQRHAPNGARSGCARLAQRGALGWRRDSIRLLSVEQVGSAGWRSRSSSRQRETPRGQSTVTSVLIPRRQVPSPSLVVRRTAPNGARSGCCRDGARVHRLAVAFLRWCEGEPTRSDRLAARFPQVVAPQACGFDRLAAPNRLSSGRALAGESNVTQRVLVVRHGRCRHFSSSLSRRRLHPAPHGLASNDSLELSGRPTAPPRPELRPGRPATQLKRYVDAGRLVRLT